MGPTVKIEVVTMHDLHVHVTLTPQEADELRMWLISSRNMDGAWATRPPVWRDAIEDLIDELADVEV